MLGAFSFDPPRIWAGGPYSGRNGGDASFDDFLPLTRLEELAWRTRIEGSLGIAEREINGPVSGWQEQYRAGLAALGRDFADVRRRRARPPPRRRSPSSRPWSTSTRARVHMLPRNTGATGHGLGWAAIEFPGDVQPRGYTDEEVSGRE